MNVDDLDRLDQISMDHRSDEEKLADHPKFKGQLPLSICEETGLAYNGDFPSELNPNFDFLNESAYCFFDLHPDLRGRVRHTKQSPQWLVDAVNQPELFQELLAKKDFAGAWFCLNSSGWEFKAARDAIWQLADAAGDEQFRTFAGVWCELPESDFCDY